MEKFEALGLKGEILKGIADLGFETPSPIQEKVIPVILNGGEDIVALAQTGTGKTAAFGLPLLQRLNTDVNTTQVLILSPTRELCMQIGNDFKNYAKYLPKIRIACVYGGTDIRRQIRDIEHGVHVIVATPGRLCDLINRDAVDIQNVERIVLDEADEMLNMGFKEDLNYILDEIPTRQNIYLFSATMPKEVERIARHYLKNPLEISVGKKNQGADTVSHQYYQVRAKDCYETLRRVIDCAPDMYAIIFTRTKIDAREIAHKLQKDGIDCDALHGDLSQNQRDDVMARFRSKRLKVLVATDVAARGLDVDNLTHVINYNLPEDVESYTHRSGRTGRAGKEGISVAIIHSKETGKLRRIENTLKKKFEYKSVPGGEEICRAQLIYYADKIIDSEGHETLTPYEDELFEKFNNLTKEQLIQKIVSYEFGRLLKKYANVPDLNLSEDERKDNGGKKSGRGERGGRQERQEDYTFTVFSVNVGKDDGLTPRELIDIINQNSPKRSLEIGSIRILDNKTKFEVDVTGIDNFPKYFRNADYDGLPFFLTEVGRGEVSNSGSGNRSRGKNNFGGGRSGSGNNGRKFRKGDDSFGGSKKRDRGGSKGRSEKRKRK